MLVYLHGRGSTPQAPRGSIYGLRTPVRLIMPYAPERFGDGFAWMPVSAAHGESPALVAALQARVRTLEDAMREWRRKHPTRGRPIVLGFSQGGIVAMTLALHHPESVARVVAMAAWVPPSLLPGPAEPYDVRAPIFALHGARDPILSAARTRRLVEQLSALGHPVTYEEFASLGHEADAAMYARVRQLLEAALRELPEERASSGAS